LISRTTIEAINDAAHVEDVVGEFVHLKKRGANMIGLCPFHDEKTPSFVVSPAKGIYKCFGCGKSGDSVKFIMEHEHYSYPQALKHLAGRYNIEVEETEVTPEQKQEADRKESLFIVLKHAAEYYQDQLLNTDQGKSVGLSYFKERGFIEDTIKAFGLGYSPDSWDAFYQDAVAKGYNEEYLEQAGLIKRKEDKVFDFFRGRVMFPIHNVSGKPVAFGGRTLKQNDRSPKYINTPETEVYHKSRLVYGIFQAKQEIRRKDESLLVEGYTDVISLYQAGFRNAVASSGTSLTPEQVRLIKRFSPNITLLFDGDKAGIKAALRGVDILLEEDANVRVILLPDGEDPDSYLRKVGSSDFQAYIEKERKDFVLFKLELLMEEGENDPIRRAEIIKDIAQSISRIKDGIKRAVYVKECSRLLEIEEKLLINETNQQRRTLVRQSGARKTYSGPDDALEAATTVPIQADQPSADKKKYYEPQEREIVRLLLLHGHKPTADGHTITASVFEVLEDLDFNHSAYSYILKSYREALEKGQSLELTNTFRAHQQEEIREICLDILAPGYEISENWFNMHEVVVRDMDDDLERIASQAAMRYKSCRLRDLLKMLDENLQSETDFDKQKELLSFRQKFELAKNELNGKLGTDILP
jgi:DNA primase